MGDMTKCEHNNYCGYCDQCDPNWEAKIEDVIEEHEAFILKKELQKKELHEALSNLYQQLLSKQEPLGAECADVLNKHRWELYRE